MDGRDLPPLERVSQRRRVEPALLVLGAAITLVAIAAWKPWVPPNLNAAAVTSMNIASGSPANASPESPAPEASEPSSAPSSPGTTTVAGLIWDAAGSRDGHNGWGVSMAYLPLGQIDDALVLRRSGMAPSLRWVSTTPGVSPRAPLGAQGAPVVALAVTWPSGVTPLAVTLRFLGHPASQVPWPSLARAMGHPVALSESLTRILGMATPGAGASLRAPAVADELDPGTYFLPPDAHATDIVDWLSQGWAPGRYEFDIELAAGRRLVVPFNLDSGV
jgi:hypothetical protein